MTVDLDKTYREEGWGLLTDEALGIPPSDVESQARAVAQHAVKIIDEMKKELALWQEVKHSSHWKARAEAAEAELAACKGPRS